MREDIIGVLKPQGFFRSLEIPDPLKPWDFKLQLARPLSAAGLRDRLAEAHYAESEVGEVILDR